LPTPQRLGGLNWNTIRHFQRVDGTNLLQDMSGKKNTLKSELKKKFN
jgi:hypothetical protein